MTAVVSPRVCVHCRVCVLQFSWSAFVDFSHLVNAAYEVFLFGLGYSLLSHVEFASLVIAQFLHFVRLLLTWLSHQPDSGVNCVIMFSFFCPVIIVAVYHLIWQPIIKPDSDQALLIPLQDAILGLLSENCSTYVQSHVPCEEKKLQCNIGMRRSLTKSWGSPENLVGGASVRMLGNCSKKSKIQMFCCIL